MSSWVLTFRSSKKGKDMYSIYFITNPAVQHVNTDLIRRRTLRFCSSSSSSQTHNWNWSLLFVCTSSPESPSITTLRHAGSGFTQCSSTGTCLRCDTPCWVYCVLSLEHTRQRRHTWTEHKWKWLRHLISCSTFTPQQHCTGGCYTASWHNRKRLLYMCHVPPSWSNTTGTCARVTERKPEQGFMAHDC